MGTRVLIYSFFAFIFLAVQTFSLESVYTLIVISAAIPWGLEVRDAWRNRRVVRRECRMLDEELDFLV